MSSFKIINPYSQKVLETFSYESLKEVESTLFELHQGFSEWKHAKTVHLSRRSDFAPHPSITFESFLLFFPLKRIDITKRYETPCFNDPGEKWGERRTPISIFQ